MESVMPIYITTQEIMDFSYSFSEAKDCISDANLACTWPFWPRPHSSVAIITKYDDISRFGFIAKVTKNGWFSKFFHILAEKSQKNVEF